MNLDLGIESLLTVQNSIATPSGALMGG